MIILSVAGMIEREIVIKKVLIVTGYKIRR